MGTNPQEKVGAVLESMCICLLMLPKHMLNHDLKAKMTSPRDRAVGVSRDLRHDDGHDAVDVDHENPAQGGHACTVDDRHEPVEESHKARLRSMMASIRCGRPLTFRK